MGAICLHGIQDFEPKSTNFAAGAGFVGAETFLAIAGFLFVAGAVLLLQAQTAPGLVFDVAQVQVVFFFLTVLFGLGLLPSATPAAAIRTTTTATFQTYFFTDILPC